MNENVSNPGSALGEAIGMIIEGALNDILRPISESKDCIYITAGPRNRKTNAETKLLLRDANGVEYNIDAVIANKRMQPLILIESKYIRYKKHNRDKGSWVCTAHQSLRRRFSSIRSSVAILAGSWSKTSKAMMRSANITLFDVPFDDICRVLADYGIDYEWEEKDREKASKAWQAYNRLTNDEKSKIGSKLIGIVEDDLEETISSILDNTVPRSISEVEIQVATNIGEIKVFKFDCIEDALEFLRTFDEDDILDNADAPSLFESQDIIGEEGEV